jgi:2-polyprenyl-6-methoxyphenol hydroxylase-like FAD-dependent oxidoreductase
MYEKATTRTILISGAGAAGQTAAYWLHRLGFDVTVVERWAAPRSGGFAIDLRGAAITVADRMGLLEQFRSRSIPMNEVVNFDPDGHVVWRTAGNYAQAEEDLEILRDSVTDILTSATSDVEHLYNNTIAALHQHDTGVDVVFADGSSRTFDLVLGCDGLHSNVRSRAFGPEKDYAAFLGHYTAVFDAPDVAQIDRQMWMCTLPGAMVSLVQWGSGNGTRGNIIATSPWISEMVRSNRSAQMDLMDQLLGGHQHWHVPEILRAMRTSADFYFDEVTQIRMDSWNTGRIGLLGDAAYAPTLISGQGTSIAVVGAYVLAHELAAANGDHAAAFERHEHRLRPFVELNQQLALGVAEAAIPATWDELDRRNRMIRIEMSSGADNLDRTTATASNAIDLSSYA